MHLNLNNTVALACFTAATFDIKRKATGRKSTQFGILCRRIKLPNIGKYPRIGRRIGARCTSNRSLIDLYNLVQRLYPLNLLRCV